MPVNWGLGVMPDVGGNALNAFKQGQQERQQADSRDALSQFATNPDAPGSFERLAQHHPQMAIQERQRREAAETAAREKQLVGAALTGNKEARRQLAYQNGEMYMKLGENEKKQLDEVYGRVAQGAWSILQMPPEQQGPALQQFLQQMQIDPSQLNMTGNPEQDLKMALAYAGKLDEWESFAQPKYTPVGEAGLAGFQFGKPIMQGGQSKNFGPELPPGFVLDDGGPTPPASGPFPR
jgi:hypothetical protein